MKLKVHIRKHVHDIRRASTSSEDELLNPTLKHFKIFHGCDASLLKIKGIDKVYLDGRRGDWRKKLAQLEVQ